MILFMHRGKQTLYRYFHDCTVCQAAPSPTTRRSPWKPEQADPAKLRLQMHSRRPHTSQMSWIHTFASAWSAMLQKPHRAQKLQHHCADVSLCPRARAH